jgi:hypothetical protein
VSESTPIEAGRVERLGAAEHERFLAERPVSLARLARARRTMPRGVPTSWMGAFCGHGPGAGRRS